MVYKPAVYLLFLATASTAVLAAPLNKRRDAGSNLQPFTGGLGGIGAPPITKSATGFECEGKSFADLPSAIQNSCDSQCNQCQKKATENGTKEDCVGQRNICLAGGAGGNGGAKTAAATEKPVKNGDGNGAKTAAATEKPGNNGNGWPKTGPVTGAGGAGDGGAKTAAATEKPASNGKDGNGWPKTGPATGAGSAGGAKTAAATEATKGKDGGNGGAKTAAATEAGVGAGAGAGGNLQQFTGNLGAPCPTVIDDGSDRPFKVENNANFDNLQNALIRSCDVQFNKCQNVFNAQPNNAQTIKQGDCQAQKDQCDAQARSTGDGGGAKTAAVTDGEELDPAKVAEVANNGSKEGADVKGDATAANQDKKDEDVNKAVEAGQAPPPPVKGGKGGIDPATGETLLPLPDTSDFCKASGQAESDGTQIKTGMCSSANIGQIPTVENMVSSVVLEPANNAELTVGEGFRIKVHVRNMDTGFFTAADTEYYTQPQTLDDKGLIKGHVHVTVQNMGDGQQAPDANVKAFFKGLNDKAEADGTISTDVPAGTITEAGNFRICTLTGAFSHQPVVMPVAQRGAQDDCIRVTFK